VGSAWPSFTVVLAYHFAIFAGPDPTTRKRPFEALKYASSISRRDTNEELAWKLNCVERDPLFAALLTVE
jgi:hypothetical protein